MYKNMCKSEELMFQYCVNKTGISNWSVYYKVTQIIAIFSFNDEIQISFKNGVPRRRRERPKT
jgi:hypothetical protein